MTIKQEYGKLLSKYNRTIGKAEKLGLDLDYGYTPVKNPTRASIRRLARIVGKAEGQVWATRELSRSENPLVRDIISEGSRQEDTDTSQDIPYMDEIIIENFRAEALRICSLSKALSALRGNKKLAYYGLNKDGDIYSAFKVYLKDREAEINEMIDGAVKSIGENKVARNIIENRAILINLIEELVYDYYSYLDHEGITDEGTEANVIEQITAILNHQ